MKRLICLIMLSTTGCAIVPANEAALCSSTEVARTKLSQALLVDGGTESRRAGAILIAGIDAGCAGITHENAPISLK